jgi:hypothetical protein
LFENLVSVAGNEFLRESRDIVLGAEEACEKYLSALTSAPQIRGKQKQDRAPFSTVNMF